jgi:hypothetical protein
MPIKGMDDVKKAIAKTKADSNIRVKAIFFDGLSEIIKETPVDTGRVRNNWFLTTREPSSKVRVGKNQGGGASFTQLKKIPKRVLGKRVYFTNNLPYIKKLEYGGYSKKSKTGKTKNGFSIQAPNGFVRDQLKLMANEVRKL